MGVLVPRRMDAQVSLMGLRARWFRPPSFRPLWLWGFLGGVLALAVAVVPSGAAEAQVRVVELVAGWNLVVYEGPTTTAGVGGEGVEEGLGNAAGSVDAVWHWEAARQGWSNWFAVEPSIATLGGLERGEVYWVRARTAVSWVQGGEGPGVDAGVELPTALIEVVSGESVFVLRVELADEAGERSRGLMLRESLDEDAGMLFLYGSETTGPFWMRNTLVPLSIAFVDGAGVIIDVQQMEPLSDTLHHPSGPYRWALEVNEGWFAEWGVGVGDVVRFTGVF